MGKNPAVPQPRKPRSTVTLVFQDSFGSEYFRLELPEQLFKLVKAEAQKNHQGLTRFFNAAVNHMLKQARREGRLS